MRSTGRKALRSLALGSNPVRSGVTGSVETRAEPSRALNLGHMTPDDAERAAVRVGVLTTVIGGVLAAAPGRVGPLIGLTDPWAARLVGLVDLALVPGLLRGRPRWVWLAARAGLNMTIVGYAVVTAGRNRRAQVAAVALVAATVSDLGAMFALRCAGR